MFQSQGVHLINAHHVGGGDQVAHQLPIRWQLVGCHAVEFQLGLLDHEAGGLQSLARVDDLGIGFDDFVLGRFANLHLQPNQFAHLLQQCHRFGGRLCLRLVQQALIDAQPHLRDQIVANRLGLVQAVFGGGAGRLGAELSCKRVFNELAHAPALNHPRNQAGQSGFVAALHGVNARVGPGLSSLNARLRTERLGLGSADIGVVAQHLANQIVHTQVGANGGDAR